MSQFNIAKLQDRMSESNAWTTLAHKVMLGENVLVGLNDVPLLKLEAQPTVRQSFATTTTALRALLVRLDSLLETSPDGSEVERQFHRICGDPTFRTLGVQRPAGTVAGHKIPSSGQVWPW